MQTNKAVDSPPVGRRPSENPLAVAISFRVDQATADALEAELEARRSPGLVLSKNDLARMLMAERLADLAAARAKKPASKK